MSNDPKCKCGQPVDAEQLAVAQMFPKLIKAEFCTACLALQNEKESIIANQKKQEMEQSARAARLNCIPPEPRRTRIDHPDFNPGLWVRVQGWQPSKLRWLGIIGLAGNCKTRCLALLAERLIMAGHHLTWTTAVAFQDQVDNLRSDRKGDADEARAYLRQCKSTGILVMDDIGKNTWNNSMERHFFDLIDHRKTHDLPILWTANSHPAQILKSKQISEDRAGPIIGRLLEASRIENV